MVKAGPLNLITDVPGLRVGHAQDASLRSGVTVIIPDEPMSAAVDVRGGAPGTRETDLLRPDCLVDRIDALVFSGGSAYGLDAASGVVDCLRAAGRGFSVPGPIGVVPIVPAAILFDLANGGDKDWGDTSPYRSLGRRAYDAASRSFEQGNVGAGLGAAAGQFKGGLGSASVTEGDLIIGALCAVNPVGSPLWSDGRLRAAQGAMAEDELEESAKPVFESDLTDPMGLRFSRLAPSAQPGGATLLAAVAINRAIDKSSAQRIAMMAQDGLARALDPVHTPLDGDCVFVMGRHDPMAAAISPLDLTRIGWMAGHVVCRAIGRAIWQAKSLGNLQSLREWRKDAINTERNQRG